MAVERKRLLLIGCGEYARKHHLPVLAEYKEHVKVAAALLGSGPDNFEETFKKAFPDEALPAIARMSLSPDDGDQIRAAVTELIETHEPVGAIISTVSAFNYDSAYACLSRKLHVLLEKPPTCPTNCCWDEEQTKKISQHLADLIRVSGNEKRLLVGAQRRYEALYNAIRDQEIPGEGPLDLIQVCHTRGWSGRTELDSPIHWRYDPGCTGGKIMHSGYHLIDIVLWWLAHRNPAITHAKVWASFERFSFKEFDRGENHNIEKTAAIQIEFYRDEAPNGSAVHADENIFP